MKIRLMYKFFLAFFLTSLAVIVLMAGVMQFFVKRNFENFVNRAEMERLGELVGTLAKAYEEHQGWDFIRKDPMAMHKMLQADRLGLSPSEGAQAPPHGMMGHHEAAPSICRPAMNPFILHIERRLSLFDADRKLVAGRAASTANHVLKEIMVNGNVVGWLGLRERRDMNRPLEAGFLYHQARAFFIIGLAAMILSAVVSYLLSRHLLRPVKALALGANSLASRKFDTRIEVNTGDELERLAHDFNHMAQTLERYEDMRRQWISDISHELRTPIAILRGEVEAIQDGIRQANEDTLDSIHTEILLLGSMVNDLHELSMADSGNLSMKKEPVDPLDILEEVLKVFTPRFSQAGISVEKDIFPDSSVKVMADRDRLFQVYSNILENSLRYTESPGRLRIRNEWTDSSLKIIFDDSKPGVPEEALDRIFDRLFRIDESRSRKHGGAGLGLAICRTIVEATGGSIIASHSSLGGLTIEVILPLKPGE